VANFARRTKPIVSSMIRFPRIEAAGDCFAGDRVGDINYYRLAAWWKCNDWSAFGEKCGRKDEER
jgi:hypothetical protein